jgi:hypothetical protein
MAEVINLNRVRKARAKADREAEASANRAKFGRTLADKRRDRDEARRAAEALEAHRRPAPPADAAPAQAETGVVPAAPLAERARPADD